MDQDYPGIFTPEFSYKGKELLARVVDIYDGDTLTVVMKAPTDTFHKFRVRIEGIDTPEMRGGDKDAAVKAKAHLFELVTCSGMDMPKSKKEMIEFLDQNSHYVTLKCGDFEKYGRLLARVITKDGVDVASSMIGAGLAYAYYGGTKN